MVKLTEEQAKFLALCVGGFPLWFRGERRQAERLVAKGLVVIKKELYQDDRAHITPLGLSVLSDSKLLGGEDAT